MYSLITEESVRRIKSLQERLFTEQRMNRDGDCMRDWAQRLERVVEECTTLVVTEDEVAMIVEARQKKDVATPAALVVTEDEVVMIVEARQKKDVATPPASR